jgi:hypothetical protein
MRLNKFIGWKEKLCAAAAFLLIGLQVAVAQVDDPPPVPVTPSSKYLDFVNKFAAAQRIDAFYFFKNFPDFKGKVLILDARFRKKISYNMIFARIWRNHGTLSLIVTDIPDNEQIPEDKPFLLAGLMTGYKNEVIDGKLESMPIIKFMGKYVCEDFRCNQ